MLFKHSTSQLFKTNNFTVTFSPEYAKNLDIKELNIPNLCLITINNRLLISDPIHHIYPGVSGNDPFYEGLLNFVKAQEFVYLPKEC